MLNNGTFRVAKPEEAAALSDLAQRSKGIGDTMLIFSRAVKKS
jgi:hypothetical protein